MGVKSLYNPGFLGENFYWWIGQIATDSTWRDNILSGKYENRDQNPGWGYRYKVRIIGLHDLGETEIPSEKLPWAQVMYPVTAGGGQANSGATANLRQGMMVFGFFLDGQEQQVPVIMGVLGNNIQTRLSTTIGDSRVTNTQPGSTATSGNANDANGNTDPNRKVPHYGLEVVRPGVSPEAALLEPPPGTKLDKYGLPFGSANLFKTISQDIQSAIAEGERKGLSGNNLDEYVKTFVKNGIQQRTDVANSPSTRSEPGATIESVDGFHKLTAADIILSEYYIKKRVLMSPCDKVKSALKAIQTVLDNLTKGIDKILNSATAYIDAVTNLLSSIQDLISNAACVIAKYMKVVFDKIMEYVLKTVNKGLAPTVEQIPLSMRHMFFDLKSNVTETITGLYSKITNNLCALIQGLLDEKINKQLPKDGSKNKKPKAPSTPICSVEDLTGDLIALNMDEIGTSVSDILDNIGDFLNDIQDQIGNVKGAIGNVKDLIGGISGSITSALSFENIKLNVFGFDLKPNCPASDYYTLQSGGGAAEDPQQPRPAEVDKKSGKTVSRPKTTEKPFARPSQNQRKVITGSNPIRLGPER